MFLNQIFLELILFNKNKFNLFIEWILMFKNNNYNLFTNKFFYLKHIKNTWNSIKKISFKGIISNKCYNEGKIINIICFISNKIKCSEIVK